MHRRSCVNVQNYLLNESERLVAVRWDEKPGLCYATSLHIEAADRTGLLADIYSVFGESSTNITATWSLSRRDGTATIDITVELQGVSHLHTLIDKLRPISDVIEVRRLDRLYKHFGRLF